MGKVKILGLSAVAVGMIFMAGCDGDTINNTTVISGDSSSGPSTCMTVIGYPYSNSFIEGINQGYEMQSMAFKGDTLYAASTDRGDYWNYLFSVDLETGEGTPIGNIGNAFDLASDPLDANSERLYATDRNWCEFKEVNTTSGDTITIDSTEEACFDTITFATDGTAYSTDGSDLYQLDINHTTGAIIGGTYLADLQISFHSLAYNSADGKLYGTPQWEFTGAVIRIDVGGVDDVNLTYVNKVDCIRDGESADGDCRLGGIDFKDGVMYGILNWGSDYPDAGALVKWNGSCGEYTGGGGRR